MTEVSIKLRGDKAENFLDSKAQMKEERKGVSLSNAEAVVRLMREADRPR